jgi:hypothetical protein
MWRARPWWLAVALLVAVSAGCGAVAQAASSPGPASSSAANPEPASSSTANAQAAQSDAASLLASLNLPPGAQQQTAEPAGDDGTLASPSSSPATPNLVDDHAWWVVPETTQAVLQYVKDHPPPGSSPGFSGGSVVPGKPTVTASGFQWPAIPGQLSIRWLIVAVAQLTDGSTGVRADSEVVWITPRPPSERIPATARRVVVTDSRGGTLVQGPITITSRAMVAKLVSLLNRLPAWQPGVYSCPADFGWRIRLAFYADRRSSPIAVAAIDPNGCGVVRLALAGKALPALADGYSAAKRVSALIHVKLDSGIT